MGKIIVVGGGIAAVQCVEELCRLLPEDEILLVSNSTKLKGVANVRRLTRSLEEFEVVERDLGSLPYKNLTTVQAAAAGLDCNKKELKLQDGTNITFDKLCICTGASPKRVVQHPLVMVLRDQDTVEELSQRLQKARRVVLVGNGGIALELAYFLKGIERGNGITVCRQVVWALKHSRIGDAFFDIDAAGFLQTELERTRSDSLIAADPNQEHKQHGKSFVQQHLQAATSLGMHRTCLCSADFCFEWGPQKCAKPCSQGLPIRDVPHPERHLYPEIHESGVYQSLACDTQGRLGGYANAVGPEWVSALSLGEQESGIRMESNCELLSVESSADDDEWPITIKLTNGKTYGADFVISAVGVSPNTGWLHGALPLAHDRGVLVDRHVSLDCCSVAWPRLWRDTVLLSVATALAGGILDTKDGPRSRSTESGSFDDC